MNETIKPVSAPTAAKPVSASVVVTGARQQVVGSGLPAADQAVQAQASHSDAANLQKMQDHVEAAVAQMNEYIQSTQRDLHFSYDKSSGETVVKVLDRSTQQVIRQIPDETFLKLARSKDIDGNFQLFSAQA